MIAQAYAMVGILNADGKEYFDDWMEEFSDLLLRQGINAAGCTQRRLTQESSNVEVFALNDIRMRGTIQISQFLGKGAKGCKLDQRALAEYAGTLVGQLHDGADCLILNRFGKAESEGGGMRAVIAFAIERGIPVLIPVREKYRGALQAFAGDLAMEVEPTPLALSVWRLSLRQSAHPRCNQF